jgi:hypothetical protein
MPQWKAILGVGSGHQIINNLELENVRRPNRSSDRKFRRMLPDEGRDGLMISPAADDYRIQRAGRQTEEASM